MLEAKGLFSYRKYWAHRFGPAPFLPMSRDEMDALGWDSCDIVLVTGDAYVDHPSFGMAIIGRLLEAQGFRVGIIAQPRLDGAPSPSRALGQPDLFFGVTAGNMDSMVNRYTADRRLRHNDSYTPHDEGGKRPDRSVIVYAQRCREAFRDVPIVRRRHRGVAAPHRPLRLLVRQGAPLDPARQQGRSPGLRQCRARHRRDRPSRRQGRDARAMRDIRGTAYLLDDLPTDRIVLPSDSIDEPVPGSRRAQGRGARPRPGADRAAAARRRPAPARSGEGCAVAEAPPPPPPEPSRQRLRDVPLERLVVRLPP